MATMQKAQKKSKLRHAEYYDFQSIQDKLYADSSSGKIFTNLMELITLPENIRLAYRNLKKNNGSRTAGTDNRTITHLEKFSDEQLIAMGVLFGKVMCRLSDGKINSLTGAADVSAILMSARGVQVEGAKYNHGNFLLMYAIGPNVAGATISSVLPIGDCGSTKQDRAAMIIIAARFGFT